MKSTDDPRMRLAVRLMRILARLCGISGKRYDEMIESLDRMTPEEREENYRENLRKIVENEERRR